MSDNNKNDWSDRELGALWVNVKNGKNEKYLTGHINNQKVIIFKNQFKEENPKAPDFRVYKHAERDSSGATEETKTEVEEEQPDLI